MLIIVYGIISVLILLLVIVAIASSLDNSKPMSSKEAQKYYKGL